MIYRYFKYVKNDNHVRLFLQAFFGIMVTLILPFLFFKPVANFIDNTEKYHSLKENFNNGEYSQVLFYHKSFHRADRLKEKAIAAWIKECTQSGDANCKEEIFQRAVMDSNLAFAAKEAFGYDEEQYLEEKAEAEKNSSRQEAIEADQPFEGMDVQYISLTGWGPPDEEKVFFDHTGNTMLRASHRNKSVDYYWYDCGDGKQYQRHVQVFNDQVSNVTNDKIGIETSEIDSRFLKCH